MTTTNFNLSSSFLWLACLPKPLLPFIWLFSWDCSGRIRKNYIRECKMVYYLIKSTCVCKGALMDLPSLFEAGTPDCLCLAFSGDVPSGCVYWRGGSWEMITSCKIRTGFGASLVNCHRAAITLRSTAWKCFQPTLFFTKQARFAVVKSMIVWTGVWLCMCACMCVYCKYDKKDDPDTLLKYGHGLDVFLVALQNIITDVSGAFWL